MFMNRHVLWRPVSAIILAPLLAFALAGCTSGGAPAKDASHEQSSASELAPLATEDESAPLATEDTLEKQPEARTQEETCAWDSPKLSALAEVPEGQNGDLPEVLVGAWQHTHIDEGSGFEEVTNDHRYVFPSPDRILYCQHVPGATEHAENAADIVLNGTAIELPGGESAYTVTAWDEDTMVWDNPVGGGYVYLLQRR